MLMTIFTEQGPELRAFEIIAEQRILDAMSRGEFDDLPGAGRPLDLSDDPFMSADQRMMGKIFKNARVAPPEVGVRKELATLRAALAAAESPEESERLRPRIGVLLIELSEMRRG